MRFSQRWELELERAPARLYFLEMSTGLGFKSAEKSPCPNKVQGFQWSGAFTCVGTGVLSALGVFF